VRYMTTPADDNKFAERANALAAAEQQTPTPTVMPPAVDKSQSLI